MRLLVYGFGPYRQFQDNITEKILRGLSRRAGLKKIVFPVRFHKRQFLNAIKAHRPEVILGLGQCSRGLRLRIESRGTNKRRPRPNQAAQRIVAGGPPTLRTNLKLDLGRHGKNSHNAGEYVCNYSMYVILDFINRRRHPIRFGFIHIPYRYDDKKAMAILEKAIGRIAAAR
jgi:pyroglutamyl-peptidase